jgi:FixJ family two-component response regulator
MNALTAEAPYRVCLQTGGGQLKEWVKQRTDLRRRSSPGTAPVPDMKKVVYIIEDDSRVREALHDLLASVGIPSVIFGKAAEYLGYLKPDIPSCLLVDIELPDMNGLELLQRIDVSAHPPIVYITGHGDIPKSVSAIKGGAVDFLPKPVARSELLAALEKAFEGDLHRKTKWKEMEALRARFASLTPRERDVLPLVVSGLLNKQAADRLKISEITFQIHRGRVMRKMEAGSLADLVRMAEKLGVPNVGGH